MLSSIVLITAAYTVQLENMTEKSLKVDREKFEGVVKRLLKADPVKRKEVKVQNPRNRKKLIPPEENNQ